MAGSGKPGAGKWSRGIGLVEVLLVLALLVAALIFLLPRGSALPGVRAEAFARLLEAKVAEAARLAGGTGGEVSLVVEPERLLLRDGAGRELFSAPIPPGVRVLSGGAPLTGEVVRYSPQGVRLGGPQEVVVEVSRLRFRFHPMDGGTVRRQVEVVP